MIRPSVLLIISLGLSGFTHIWNASGYPIPNADEGIYLGRAMNFLDTYNLVDPYIGYDHPYFGQIVLSGFLYLVGYQNLLTEPSGKSEILLQIPRIIMGLLAVLDTFLIFRIVQLWYDKKMAFFASILFAVMPVTLQTRWVMLDSLQLPFILSSILFAIISGHRTGSDNRKDVLLVLVSGIFLGLSIFIKIPAFTMIPLISYLVYTQNKKSLRLIALWVIPVLLIPGLWPLHAISLGQWGAWLDAINWQSNRESNPLNIALQDFFNTDAILLTLGFFALIYSAIRKDLFILLFAIPILIFAILINYVDLVHLVILVVAICIATAKFIVDILSFTKNKNQFLHLSSIGVIAVIIVLGFAITARQITVDENLQYFKAAEFINLYFEESRNNKNGIKDNNGITVVSHPFFFWVEKYKFNNENNYYWHINEFATDKIIFIIDKKFKSVIERNAYGYGDKYRNLFSAFHTRQIASFSDNSKNDSTGIRVLQTNLQQYNKDKISVQKILDEDHEWTNSKFVQLQRENGKLNLTLDGRMLTRKNNVNYAYLNNTINFSRAPAYLQLSYYIPLTTKGTFTVELENVEGNKKLWDHKLRGPKGVEKSEFFILPQNLFQKKVNVDIKVKSLAKGIDSLILNNFSIYY